MTSIYDLICSHLSVAELCAVAQVNRAFKTAAYNDSLWIARLQRIQANYKARDVTPDVSGPTHVMDQCLNVFKSRPDASPREVFITLYRTLEPLYEDLARNSFNSPLLFRLFDDPQDQARLLKQLRAYSKADPLEDSHFDKVATLDTVVEVFENAALSGFEKGYDKMRHEQDPQQKASAAAETLNFSTTLMILNGGESCVQLYIERSEAFDVQPLEGLKDAEGLKVWLGELEKIICIEKDEIALIFPRSLPVLKMLMSRLLEEQVLHVVDALIKQANDSETDDNSPEKTMADMTLIPAVYTALVDFSCSVVTDERTQHDVMAVINELFGNYVSLYLDAELKNFMLTAKQKVASWNKAVKDAETATTTLLLSNVVKEKDKNDLMTSFKNIFTTPFAPFMATSTTTATSTSTSTSTGPVDARSRKLALPPSVVGSIVVAGNGHGDSSHLAVESSLSPVRSSSPVVKLPEKLPDNEFDAMVEIMNSKLDNIKTLFSLELAIGMIKRAKESIERIVKFLPMGPAIQKEIKSHSEDIFIELVLILGWSHVKEGFDKALSTLKEYNPRDFRQTVTDAESKNVAVEPLAIFAELVNIGDLIQQMMHIFFEEELVARKFADKNDFMSRSQNAKKRFEQMLDDCVANGLNRGIDVLIEEVDFTFVTVQLGSDFDPPSALAGTMDTDPTKAAVRVISLLKSHVRLLQGSTDKALIDVFQQEVVMRFFGSVVKHIQRQTISYDGGMKLLCDLNYYYSFVVSLRLPQMYPYFVALKEVGQMYLVDARNAKEIGTIISDSNRYRGVFTAEEMYSFAKCRKDWPVVKRDVERAIYGFDCQMM